SSGLLQREPREWFSVRKLAMQCVADEQRQVREIERPQQNALQFNPCRFERAQSPDQRMAGVNFIVAVGAHQEEIFNFMAGEQWPEQAQCRRISPLQVIEKDDQRALLPGQCPDEILKDQLKPV